MPLCKGLCWQEAFLGMQDGRGQAPYPSVWVNDAGAHVTICFPLPHCPGARGSACHAWVSSCTLNSLATAGLGDRQEAPHQSLVYPLGDPSCLLPDGKEQPESPRGGGNLPEQSAPNPWAVPQTGDGGCRAWELGHPCSQTPAPLGKPSAAQGL